MSFLYKYLSSILDHLSENNNLLENYPPFKKHYFKAHQILHSPWTFKSIYMHTLGDLGILHGAHEDKPNHTHVTQNWKTLRCNANLMCLIYKASICSTRKNIWASLCFSKSIMLTFKWIFPFINYLSRFRNAYPKLGDRLLLVMSRLTKVFDMYDLNGK